MTVYSSLVKKPEEITALGQRFLFADRGIFHSSFNYGQTVVCSRAQWKCVINWWMSKSVDRAFCFNADKLCFIVPIVSK